MLTNVIVLIVVRLFSVLWFVQGLSMAAISSSELAYFPDNSSKFLRFLPSLFLLVMSIVGWMVAPPLSLRVLGKQDVSIPVTGLSLHDLYSFAFVFLGLYFALSSVGDVLNWLQYSLRISLAHDFDPERRKSLYALSRPLITFVAGLICLFMGRRWATKLSN